MVIDHVQDLDLGPIGELPMGDVGLPHLVGHLGLEPYERAPWSLLGLGCDEAPAAEDSPDRGDRRGGAVAPLQVEADGVGARVESFLG